MENEIDLTLRLSLPSPSVETHVKSLHGPTFDQEVNIHVGRRYNNDGGKIHGRRLSIWGEDELIDDEECARNNVNVNSRVFQHFAGVHDTLYFAPYQMPPSPAPAPTPAPALAPELATLNANDHVLIDVPARRAQHSNSLAIENALDANANANANANHKQCRDCGGMIDGTRKCTNMNCNATVTPMWRRGPLGPKTLCNACGIKFMKEKKRSSNKKSD